MSKKEAVQCLGKETCGLPPPGNQLAETIERPGHAFAAGTYAGTDEDESGGYAAAGVGYTRAEWSVFDAEARGPNASIGSSFSASGFKSMSKAELASASVSAGPVKAKLGLGVDTGLAVGSGGVEAKVLGTGVSIGRRMEVSLFGSSIGFDLW